jgi:hypothetical protein
MMQQENYFILKTGTIDFSTTSPFQTMSLNNKGNIKLSRAQRKLRNVMIRSSHSRNSLFCFICKKMFNITSQHTSGQFKWLCNCVSPYRIQVQYGSHYFREQKKESFIITTVVINSGYLKMWAHNAEKLNCKMHNNVWEIPDKKEAGQKLSYSPQPVK